MVASRGSELMHCPECESQQVVKNGKVTLQDGYDSSNGNGILWSPSLDA
ncbi:hypothetical protein ACKFKF_16325 [Phormidesmis sp. 146-12]